MMGCKCAHAEMISEEVASLSSHGKSGTIPLKLLPTAQSLPEAAATFSGVAAGPQG